MDKQECLEILNQKIDKVQEETDRSPEGSSYGTLMLGRKQAFSDVRGLLKTLESEKPEIPQFVAKEIPSAPKEALDRYYNPGVYVVPPYSYKVINWIEGHFDIFLQALVNGFEIQKEPAWVVKAPYDRYFGGFLEKGQHAEINFSHINRDNAQKFEDKSKAVAVATLVDGTVEEWSE